MVLICVKKTNTTLHQLTIYIRWVVCFFLLACPCGQTNATETIVLDKNTNVYYLENRAYVMHDDSANYSAEEIASGQYDDQFTLLTLRSPNFGYPKGAIWMRFTITNPLDQAQDLMVELNNSPIEYVNFLYKDQLNQLNSITTGTAYPFSSRPIRDGFYIFPITLAAQSSQTYYFRLQSHNPLAAPISIRTPQEHTYQAKITKLILGIIIGSLFSLMLYNLFLYSAFRDTTYIYYVSFIFSAMLFHMASYGVSQQFLLDNIEFNKSARGIAATTSLLFAMQFGRAFFHSKYSVKKFDYVLKSTVFALLAILLSIILFGPTWVLILIPIFVLIVVFSMISLGVIRLLQGYKPARYFLLSWILLMASAITFPLANFGIIKFNIFIQWSFQIGSCLEAILLSFALADRINLLKQEKFQSEQEAKEAKKLSEAKSNFLAKMSHEIRTPMNGVLGMAELLRTSQLQPLQKHYADVIFGSGKALLSVINDILDHAKIEAGKMQLENIPFNLDALLNECAAVFAITARDKQLPLMVNLNPDVPIALKGDPTRLRQILLNLLSNAFKFTEHGEILITVSLDKTALDDNIHLQFAVKDTGVGITQEDQTLLFQPYSQADNSIMRRFGGTGLGLTISHQLVKMMNGSINVNSSPGHGSTFWFTASFELAKEHELSLPVLDKSQLVGKRLLIIDDHIAFCQVIKTITSSWGMTSKAAYTGKEGLSELASAENSFDILILDMHLPDIEGLDIAQKIQENPAIKSPPILLITGVEQIPTADVLKEIGIGLALEKPMSNQQLCDGLIHLLSNQTSELQTLGNNYSREKPIKSMRVLIAEDNAINQLVIESLLKKLGATSELVPDGKKAVQLVKEKHNEFDIILMDCEMPELNGYDATRKIRAFEQTNELPHLPIIALTAHVMQEHREKSIASGMDDHLTKPINLSQLREKLSSFSHKNT